MSNDIIWVQTFAKVKIAASKEGDKAPRICFSHSQLSVKSVLGKQTKKSQIMVSINFCLIIIRLKLLQVKHLHILNSNDKGCMYDSSLS